MREKEKENARTREKTLAHEKDGVGRESGRLSMEFEVVIYVIVL